MAGNLTGCLKKLVGCSLMISASAKVLYQEALENSLRSHSSEFHDCFTPQFDVRNEKEKIAE